MYSVAKNLKRVASTLVLMSLALTLFVTNVAPVNASTAAISSFDVVQTSFNPNNESARINFNLNVGGKIGLEIHEGSNPIKTLAIRKDVTAGAQTYTWDGTNDSGQKVAAGTYKAQLLFYGEDFALFADDTVTVSYGGTIQPVDVITNDYANPQEFDPRLEYTRVYFTLAQSVEQLTVTIEKNGVLVTTLIANQSKAAGTFYTTWNGRDKNNVIVGEGEYRYVITAKGSFGTDTEYGYILSSYGNAIGVPPFVTNDSVAPSTFDPNTQEATVSYTLNTTADVTVKVYDNSALVDVLVNNVSKTAGTYSVKWDGRNSSNVIVAPGTYKYIIYAENAWGEDMEDGVVTVAYDNGGSVTAPNVTNAYASPEEFDPSDGETTRINYTLNTCSYITIKVYKKSDNTFVTTLKEFEYQCAGTYNSVWNGRNSSNQIVANGEYNIKVSAANSEGADTEQDTVAVVDDDGSSTVVVPNVTNAYVSPEEFDASEGETTRMYYTTNTCAYVTVKVYNSSNNLVRTLKDNVYECAGTYNVLWNGRNSSNTLMSDATYTIKVTANNSKGSDTEQDTVEVNNSSDDDEDDDDGDEDAVPSITRVEVDPETFDPYDEETELSFKLNTCAYVTIEVRDEDDDKVVEILDNKRLCEGTHDYDWDGEDEDGDLVRQDDYEFYIKARNSYGTDTERADVEIDYNGHTVDETERCAGYLDVSASDPYCEAIEYVKGSGIFDGYPDGYFRPYQAINRAETTKVIVRAFNYPELPADGTNLGFWDLSPWDWYMGYIRTAKQHGIIQGYPDGSFKPAQTVNRVELLKIFLESASVALPTCYGQSYPDTQVGVWYSDYVCYSKMHGLMNTDYYGNFNPAKPMTRGDVAELFYRYSERNLGGGYDYNDYTSSTDSLKVSSIKLSDYVVEEGDGFRIYYTLNQSADVTVEILDEEKDELRTLVDDIYQSKGERTVFFNGEDDDEDALEEGEYFVRIEAENSNGKYRTDVKFEVDNDASGDLMITSLALSRDEFDPYSGETVRISFRINDDAEVTVRVYDEDGDLVAELWDDEDKNEGSLSLTWNGRDDDGDRVSDGDYTIKVIADNGDETDKKEIDVEVDR